MVAHQLGFEFLDTDALIERRSGKSISRIFAEEGEPRFRAWEAELVAELATRSGLVVATGGGLAANPQHLESLKQHALVVWLWASPESLWDRVRHHQHRPRRQTPHASANSSPNENPFIARRMCW
jgi:shikimate kinase